MTVDSRLSEIREATLQVTNHIRTTAARFGRLNLADCRVVGIHIENVDDAGSDEVAFDLLLIEGENADGWQPARLTFTGATALEIKLDLWAKGACGDTITDAYCRDDMIDVLAAMHEYNSVRETEQPLESLALFIVELCSPSGQIRIIAQDFALVRKATSAED